MGINVGSENWSKLRKGTGVNIDSKMGTESQSWGSESHSHSSSVSLNKKLANLSKVWDWSSSSLCNEIRYHNFLFLSVWVGQSGMVENVLGRVLHSYLLLC